MPDLLNFHDLLDEPLDSNDSPRTTTRPFQKKTILVVSPSRTLRNTTRTVLESLGYRIVVASDAFAGADELRRSDAIELVLLDECQPGWNGFQICKMFRHCDQPTPPIVLLAKTVGVWKRMRSRWAGAVAVIAVRKSPERLIEIVKRYVPVEAISSFSPRPHANVTIPMAESAAPNDITKRTVGTGNC